MKLALYAICAAVVVISGTGCTTEGGTAARVGGPGAVVTVQYVSPQTFTDFSVQGRSVLSSTSIFTQDVMRTLVPVMRSRFPGNMLTLRFTDIDLAGGRFAGRPGSVRILRPNTSIHLSFVYMVKDEFGRTLASGSRTLVDSLHRTLARNPSSSRPLYFETRMLRRWLESL
jgi:Protein of unknown function (DUF3016)